jgi:hypothetical protein
VRRIELVDEGLKSIGQEDLKNLEKSESATMKHLERAQPTLKIKSPLLKAKAQHAFKKKLGPHKLSRVMEKIILKP